MEKNNNQKRFASAMLITSISLSSIGLVTGCSKNVPCGIESNHVHYYVNSNNMGRYILGEKETRHGLKRTDNYINISEDDKKLYDFLDKNALYKISDNIVIINSICENNVDYLEYYFSNTVNELTPLPDMDGGVSYQWIPKTKSGWTTDPNQPGVTGEKRICQYKYYGYKVEKTEDGKYTITESDLFDSITDLPEGYDYIKETFYTTVPLYLSEEQSYSRRLIK